MRSDCPSKVQTAPPQAPRRGGYKPRTSVWGRTGRMEPRPHYIFPLGVPRPGTPSSGPVSAFWGTVTTEAVFVQWRASQRPPREGRVPVSGRDGFTPAAWRNEGHERARPVLERLVLAAGKPPRPPGVWMWFCGRAAKAAVRPWGLGWRQAARGQCLQGGRQGAGCRVPRSVGPRKEPLRHWSGTLPACRCADQKDHCEPRVYRVESSGHRSGLQLHRESPAGGQWLTVRTVVCTVTCRFLGAAFR